MKRTLTCIVCPRGCTVTVEQNRTVTGNGCKRGIDYAIAECTNPTRTVTATVRVANRADTMVSVKTAAPVPKGEMFAVMQKLRAMTVSAPIAIGDVILNDIYGTQIIATKNIK